MNIIKPFLKREQFPSDEFHFKTRDHCDSNMCVTKDMVVDVFVDIIAVLPQLT